MARELILSSPTVATKSFKRNPIGGLNNISRHGGADGIRPMFAYRKSGGDAKHRARGAFWFWKFFLTSLPA